VQPPIVQIKIIFGYRIAQCQPLRLMPQAASTRSDAWIGRRPEAAPFDAVDGCHCREWELLRPGEDALRDRARRLKVETMPDTLDDL
jgi:hypothetical protein